MPIVSFPIGTRRFAPTWLMTLLTIALCLVFIRLGDWQWDRGVRRQAEWDAFARGADAPMTLGAQRLGSLPRFKRISVPGTWDVERQFLIDNRSHGGLPGYEVLTPLRLSDGRVLLVDRGWVPFTGSRAHLPVISLGRTAPVSLTGRLDNVPAGGLALGHAAPTTDSTWPKVTRLSHAGRVECRAGREGRTVDAAARSRQPRWLRAGLATAGAVTAAPLVLCHPMVGIRCDAGDHLGDHELPAAGAQSLDEQHHRS